MVPSSIPRLSFTARIQHCKNTAARQLLALMEKKQSNLALAADVTSCAELLQLVAAVGEHICLLKTHIDVLQDFTPELLTKLLELKQTYQFMIFEDRKFADIGNTVRLQYGAGIYQIAEWADFINAHILPGPGIIEGLSQVGAERGRGLLLLAEMSSQGNLLDAAYRRQAGQWAQQYPEFVCGWIAQHDFMQQPGMLVMTPGISIQQQTDSLKQAYTTPQVAVQAGADVVIVGRSIYQAQDPQQAAAAYQRCAWESYQKVINV